MTDADPLQLNFVSDPKNLPGVREVVRGWLNRRGWTTQQVADIVLAVDEALTNVIRHGYDGKADRPIEFGLRSIHSPKDGEGLEICIRDYGKQVDLSKICGRDLADIRPGGLGVHIIHAMMSCSTYEHAEGGGMRLIMVKYKTHVAECRD